jgi:hypothetical protein
MNDQRDGDGEYSPRVSCADYRACATYHYPACLARACPSVPSVLPKSVHLSCLSLSVCLSRASCLNLFWSCLSPLLHSSRAGSCASCPNWAVHHARLTTLCYPPYLAVAAGCWPSVYATASGASAVSTGPRGFYTGPLTSFSSDRCTHCRRCVSVNSRNGSRLRSS